MSEAQTMNCNECDIPVEATNWIMLVIKNGHEITTGFVCSIDCLIDYTAKVGALEAGIGDNDADI